MRISDPTALPTDDELYALSSEVGARLKAEHLSLVTAESCTGGWIAKAITDVPGCSAWFECGIAAYSYEAKQALLGVRPEILHKQGAVSEETALEMVSGALIHAGAAVAVAVTGIAGPSGGTPENRSARSGWRGSGAAAIRWPNCTSSTATAMRSAARPWTSRCADCCA